ncbi:MAG: NAD(P)H-binding protein [Pseudomonadota bacterium]|nr:NAD(P)H-binding protein [Pseudomonadota bacterium]
MSSPTTLIIGKHAKTGSRVDALLRAQGHATRAVSRSTAPAFDWDHPAGWAQAMAGCRAAYVTFQPDLAVPGARETLARFIETARQAGLEHLVLLSGRGEAGAQQAEQVLMNSGLTWNVVRASWFDQNFSEGFLIEGVLQGEVALPSGDVPEPFIDVDDIAEVAVACLTRPELANTLFEVTGPELLTFQQCVAILAEELQRPIEFVPISARQLLQGLEAQGLPEPMLWLMNELFTVVMDGRNSRLEQGVMQALGRPARSFRDYVRKTAALGVWQEAASPVAAGATAGAQAQ